MQADIMKARVSERMKDMQRLAQSMLGKEKLYIETEEAGCGYGEEQIEESYSVGD